MKEKRDLKENFNMKVGVSKGKLVITVDLNDYLDKAELSASGKSYSIASSYGNKNLVAKGFEDIKFGANVYMPKARFEELLKIRELEKNGGKVVSGLPSQHRDKELEEKDAIIAQQTKMLEETNARMDALMKLVEGKLGK